MFADHSAITNSPPEVEFLETEGRIHELEEVWFEHYLTFDRMLNSLKIASDDMVQTDLFIDDFLDRLERGPLDRHSEPLSLEKILPWSFAGTSPGICV
jgi:hypothetical protein